VFNGDQFAKNRSHRAGITGWVTTVSAPPEAILVSDARADVAGNAHGALAGAIDSGSARGVGGDRADANNGKSTAREGGGHRRGSDDGGDDVSYLLDLGRAVLIKRSGWALNGGGRLAIEETHYAHRALRSLLVCTITLTNTGSTDVTVPIRQASGVFSASFPFLSHFRAQCMHVAHIPLGGSAAASLLLLLLLLCCCCCCFFAAAAVMLLLL
jgi:hypothetical protein